MVLVQTAICKCNFGYWGHDKTGSGDIDECFRVCQPGFEPDGNDLCMNINECENGKNECHEDAICKDTEGSYECKCDVGYVGDGLTCESENECRRNGALCHPKADCLDNGDSYTCFCRSGYEGDGYSWWVSKFSEKVRFYLIQFFEIHNSQNIDECANNGHKCSIIATCLDRDGGYTCQCPEGFRNGV